MTRLSILLATTAALACAGALGAAAAEYPSKPVQVIVPAGAGGGTDTLIRTIQPYLEAELGGDVVVINVPGSGSVAGSRRALEAEPDGHTVLVNHTTLLSAIALGKADFSYTDFEISATAVEMPLVVVVPGDSEIDDLTELMEASKNTDDPLIAGVNLGALNHFAMLMLQNQVDGSSFRYVQTGGGAKTSAALLGGHIAVGVLAGPEAKPLVASGDVKLVTSLGDERISYFPDTPTAKEQGIDAAMGIQYSWYLPKGTPADRVEKFAAALGTALENQDLLAALDDRGIAATYFSGDVGVAKVSSLFATLEGIAAGLEQ